MKQKIQINLQDFLEWRFSDKEDLEYLGELALECIAESKPISLDEIWASTGYLPIDLVRGGIEIPEDEDELCPEDYEVEWIR